MNAGSAGVVIRREVKDTFTDWRVMVPMLVLALLLPGILVGSINLGLPYMERVDPLLAQEKAALFGAAMSAFFPISFSLVLALESFAGEKERNTLEALLVSPMSDAEIFFGKFIAVLIPPTVLSILGLLVFTLGSYATMKVVVPPDFLLLALLLSAVEALAMVAAAVVVSSQTATVKAANLLASFIIIPVALVVQGEVLLLFLGYGSLLWLIVVEFLLIAIVLVRIGVQIFNREEILTREGDEFNPRSVWRAVQRFWERPPSASLVAGSERPVTVQRLYLTDFPQLLSARRGQLGVTLTFLVLGVSVGIWFALQHPLPIGAPAPSGEQAATLLLSLSAWDIFVHNFRILALSAVLSLFTFGAAGALVVVFSGGAIGFVLTEASLAGYDTAALLLGGILPHGILEIPALLLAGALNLSLGMCLMTLPKGHSLGDGVILAMVNWWKGAAVFVPLLLAAAIIEANVTPMLAIRLLGA